MYLHERQRALSLQQVQAEFKRLTQRGWTERFMLLTAPQSHCLIPLKGTGKAMIPHAPSVVNFNMVLLRRGGN